MSKVTVPTLAENVTSGTVVKIFVKEGDAVRKNQDLMELETEKAVASIPSPEDGVIAKLLVKEGADVKVGQVICEITAKGGAAKAQESKIEETAAAPAPKAAGSVQAAAAPRKEGKEQPVSAAGIAAAPSVRILARQLGIDLARVRGSERGGRIVIEDIKAYIQQLQGGGTPSESAAAQESRPAAKAAAPSVDFSKWGPVRKEKMSNLRKKISSAMVHSWTTIPHVNQFDEADVTGLGAIAEKHGEAFKKKGGRLTVTVLLLKALVPVLKKHAIFNASLDEAAEEIVYKDYLHLGIAVDTEQGLIVPVIRDVDKKSALELSKELVALAEKTRARKVAIEDLKGGTFTISNQGGIGGGHFTPIINAPETAILGIGRSKPKPVARDGKVEIRTLVPLALSYDHRLIDGGKAARFIRELVESIENFDEKEIKTEKKS